MVTINTNHSVNIPGGYYTENHHTDPTTATSAELDAAKAGRFFFQLSDALGSGGRIIGMGSMSFTDTGTVDTNANVDSSLSTYGGYAISNLSSGHIESTGFAGVNDLTMTIDSMVGKSIGEPGLLSAGDSSTSHGYIQLYGIVLDGNEAAGTKSASLVGYQIPINVGGSTQYLFFPTADQDLSNVTLPSENGSVSTISHLDVLDDQDSITTWTYASYLDLGAYSDVAGGSSDKIVSGTSGNDSIDGTYTGDGDGDIVDNYDGNPNEAAGNNDSIEAGDGDDRINGGDGNDTMLGQGGDDTFVLTGANPGNDSIVGGETSESMGDHIDMSGLTEGVSIDMSAGSGESGTIYVGGLNSGPKPTSNGGTNFAANDLFGGPAFDYGNGKMYVDSGVNTDALINHVQAGGTDYIVHTGASGTEFWSMDPDTGELTLEHDFDRSFSFHAGATPANTEFVEVGGTLYAYAENREFMDVFKFDASTGNWTAEAEYRWSDVNPTGLNGGNVGPADVHTFPDGKTYAYVISQHNGSGHLNAYEIDQSTGLPDFSTREEWPSTGVGGASNMHIVETNDGIKMVTNNGLDSMRVWDMGDDGTFLGTFTEISLGSTGGRYDATAASVNEPFVDANGYLIFAGGHDTGNPQSEPEGGTITIYDPATDSVVRQISNTNLNGRGTYSVDADGYIYVTTNSLSGGGSTTRPFTMVLDPDNNYNVVSSGHDTNGGFIGIHQQSPGIYYGPTSSIHVTTTTGENFFVQGHGGSTNALNGYITASSSNLAGVGTGYIGATATTTFEEIEKLTLTDHADSLTGSSGDDSVDGGAGADTIYGEGGNDTIALEDGFGNDSIEGGEDSGDSDVDVLDLTALSTGATVDLSANGASDPESGTVTVGGDSVTGGAGDDEFTIDSSVSDTGTITIVGGETDEEDTVDPTNNPSGRVGDLLDLSNLNNVVVTYDQTDPTWDGTTSESGTVTYTNDNGDTLTIDFSEIEHIKLPSDRIVEGTSGADLIDGSYTGDPDGDLVDNDDGNPNEISGDSDSILGYAGDDTINSGAGDDTVDGGADDDEIDGGAGDDSILVGEGDDVIKITDNFGNDTIAGGEDGETDGDTLDASGSTADLTLNLYTGEGVDLPDRDANSDNTHFEFVGYKIEGSDPSNLAVTQIADVTFYDAGEDIYQADETDRGVESYSNIGGQTNAWMRLGDGTTHNSFGQILFGTADFGGEFVYGYYVEVYTNSGSEYFFFPQRDEDSSNVDVGDSFVMTSVDMNQNVMPYDNISSRNNTESGTLTDGTSTATFTEIENYVLGSGDDKVIGSTEADNVSTGTGADTVDGGEGDDTFDLGGNDGDRDEVVLENGDGHDTITGIEGPTDLGGGNYSAQDQLNVSGLNDNDGNPVNTGDVTITVDGNGHPTITFPDGTAVTLEGLTAPSTDPSDPATKSWLVALGIPAAPNYIVEGTSGGDLINASYTGDPEGDMVDANDNQDGDNDDSIDAGEGDDIIYAGDGDDTVRADEGDDEVYGGAGNDSIYGFEGSDTVDGGDGNDYINTRTSLGTGEPDATFTVPDNPLTTGVDESLISYGPDSDPNNDRDSVIGGAGNDTILTGDDDDTIQGGTGEDHIDAGYDDDSVDAGADDDTVVGNEGNDTIDGGDGDDVIYGGLDPNETYVVDGVTYTGAQVNALYSITDDLDPNTTNNNDSLVGGAGNDTIYGQDDEDTLEGGVGNDVLDGGIDDDTVIGGTGDDVMTGGEGDDHFVLDLAGNDTITDFGAGISGGVKDDDQTNNDFIDLSGSYDRLKDLREDLIDDGILNHSNSTANGGTADYTGLAAITGGLTLTGAAASGLTWDSTNVMCFTAGTLIRTAEGLVPAEEITQGMLVWTKDDGYQPIRWIGTRQISKADLETHANVRPIRIKAGALGQNMPERDLTVSPQHRILVNSKLARRLHGEDEVLVAAKHLLQVEGIDVVQDAENVTYVHFLFDRHQIVESEGAETESLFTGPEALKTVDSAARVEILHLFPELASIDYDRLPDPVRPILSGRQGRKLANRHANNKKHLAQ